MNPVYLDTARLLTHVAPPAPAGLMAVIALDVGPVDVDEVFADLEGRRPALADQLTRAPMRFQASRTHPGLLERMDPDGRVTVGQFEQGEFQPLEVG